MKTITLFTAILLTSILSFGQNPSMTIAHSGIVTAPSSNDKSLTVYVGDSIDFIHGGGGSHPMTEGWQTGEISTPITFSTQTVTSSNPSTTFALNTAGTYYFHCGTNPGNTDNWGKITVLPSTTGIDENKSVEYKIYPNPVSNILTIEGLKGTSEIYNLLGKKVIESNSQTINIENLPKGNYVIKIGEYKSTFIKN